MGHKFEHIRRIMDLMFELKEKSDSTKNSDKDNTDGAEKSTNTADKSKRIPERIGVCLDT